MPKSDNKETLLRAAYDILKRSDESYFVQSALELHAHFHSADCDGYCLMEEIADELGLEEDTPPIPLSDN